MEFPWSPAIPEVVTTQHFRYCSVVLSLPKFLVQVWCSWHTVVSSYDPWNSIIFSCVQVFLGKIFGFWHAYYWHKCSEKVMSEVMWLLQCGQLLLPKRGRHRVLNRHWASLFLVHLCPGLAQMQHQLVVMRLEHVMCLRDGCWAASFSPVLLVDSFLCAPHYRWGILGIREAFL